MNQPCKKCNFDYGFLNDYDHEGKEYTFCHNCGTVVFPQTNECEEEMK